MPHDDLTRAAWRKSRYSYEQGACVEVAQFPHGVVGIRDSTDPTGPALRFTPTAFRGLESAELISAASEE
jgi:hypothetical protein